ncbi:MAG: cadherin-like domain-containing protein, partial [Gammaproteobacteria bacterium]|nr:cadherin-like domain-containing protein [Gammaproteobacteria bacterium]
MAGLGCSGGGGSDPETSLQSVNRAPNAGSSKLKVVAGADLVIPVLSLSSDIDNDPLSISYITQPEHGSTLIHDNGTDSPFDDYVVFSCPPDFAGVVSFEYTVSDGSNGRATGQIEITVGSAGNNPPSAGNDFVVTAMNSSYAIDVLSNDSDIDGDEVHIESFEQPLIGSVTLDDNGTASVGDDLLVYTPLAGFVGSDTFFYVVSDGASSVRGAVTVTIGTPVDTEQVCGTVMKGALQQATVLLLPIGGDGYPSSPVPIAAAVTNEVGNWCTQVPVSRGDLLVRTLGGFFVDETDTTGQRVISLAPEDHLETMLPAGEYQAAVNVFTNALLIKSRLGTRDDEFAALFDINRELFRTAFAWGNDRDLLSERPADPAQLNVVSPVIARNYGMALGGIANVVNNVSVAYAQSAMTHEMIEAVVLDLSDCWLDGHYFDPDAVRTRVNFDLNGQLRPLPDSLDLNLEIVRFRNNNQTQFQNVPLAQIDGAVCLGNSDDADGSPPVFVARPLPDRLLPATGPLTDLLSAVVVPFATDNLDPNPSVSAIAVVDGAGTSYPPNAANVPPGVYFVTWRASDATGNTTDSVQRVEVFQAGDGAIAFDTASIVPGQPIGITVVDTDLDTDPNLIDSVTITARNASSGETETLLLAETGPSSAEFTAVLTTSFGLTAGVTGDGSLQVQAGQSIVGEYIDQANSIGVTVSRLATADVLGGSSGSLLAAPAFILPGQSLTVSLVDSDLDTTAAADTIVVVVENLSSGDSESLSLTETGPTTGEFDAAIGTVFGTGGTSGDAVISVQAGETIRAYYDDVLGTIGDDPAPVIADAAVTGGFSGTLTAGPAAILPGETITVAITDHDLDSSGVADSIGVIAVNTVTGENETIVLVETGANSGVFEGSLATAFGATAGPAGDNQLNVQAGDSVSVSYDDALGTAGNDPAVQTVSVLVNNGNTGTLSHDLTSLTPGQSIGVALTDLDLDTSAVADTVIIAVENIFIPGETASITLTETGANTGVFQGVINTAYGTVAGVSGDDILNVADGDTVRSHYDDALGNDGGDPAAIFVDSDVVGGDTGAIVHDVASINPGQSIQITVTDTDLDTTAAADSVVVAVVNTAIVGETASITLTETGNNTGVFLGTVNTVYGTAAGVTTDDTLNVADTDTVQSSYDDALDAAGDNPAAVTTSTTVVGGDTGTIAHDVASINPGQSIQITVTDTDLDTT